MSTKQIVIGAIIALAVIVAIGSFVWLRGAGTPAAPAAAPGTAVTGGASGGSGITNITLDLDSYHSALAAAAAWKPDAALFKMQSADASGNDWDFTFVSPKTKGKAFAVTVDGTTIVATSTVDFVGGGAALPADLISPDQAIAEVRAIPGYADANIASITIVYSANARAWYWGVKTTTGSTVSVKATP